MNEVWKDIEGFEGFYQVSNLGRIRSLDREFINAAGRRRFYPGTVLVPCGNPYLHVMLSKHSKCTPRKIHRLVAEAFIPNPDKLPCIDHIDCNKKNNRVDNLRWCSYAENMRYASENGLTHTKPYELLSDEAKENMVADKRRSVIRDDGEVYPSITAAARALGVTRPAVGHVLTGLVETCKGHTFRYATSESSPAGLFS